MGTAMHPSVTLEANQRSMRSFAQRVLRRVRSAGAASIDLEDILQELSLAWVKAVERWNPETGVPFGAYLFRGMRDHINRWVKHELDQLNLLPISLDTPVRHTEGNTASSYQTTMADFVEDERPSIEEDLATKQVRDRSLKRLSDKARQFYEILESPPPALVREIDAIQERVRFARSRGITTAARMEISAGLIFDLMGIGRSERLTITREINMLREVVQ